MEFISGAGPKRLSGDEQSRSEFGVFINEYLRRVAQARPKCREELQVTVIARAPDSLVAQALSAHCELFRDADIGLRAIFARLSPQQAAKAWFLSFPSEDGGSGNDCVRLVKNPKLLDAHEQLTLGRSMCWSGDALRSSREGQHRISVFEDECPGSARLGQLAFRALWDAAVDMPRKYVERLLVSRSECPPGELAAPSSESPVPQTKHHWISTRH
jgi:hypothetical protein